MSKITQKRIVSPEGQTNSGHVTKVFIKENDGDFGAVVSIDSTDAILVTEVSVTPEVNDIESKVKNSSYDKSIPVRTREHSKVKLQMEIQTGDAAIDKWAIHPMLKRAVGEHEAITSDRDASVSLLDPKNIISGLVVESAGVLSGSKGNFSKIKFLNAGPTGTVTAVQSGKNLEVTYFNDSVVDDVTAEINALTDFQATDDGSGDSSTDKMIDLLASQGRSSGTELRLADGAEIGHYYKNENPSKKDLNLIFNEEKVGRLVTGLGLESWSINLGGDLPTFECELMGRKYRDQGVSTVKTNVTANTKIYVNSAKQFKKDDSVDSFVDVISQDKRTVKHSALKLIDASSDVGGSFVIVNAPVTCLQNDIVIFHEPSNSTYQASPHSGLGGSLEINGLTIGTATNFKLDGKNALEWFDKYLKSSTLEGFEIKDREIKMSMDATFWTSHMELYSDMNDNAIVPMNFQYTTGIGPGKILQVQGYSVTFKKPNTQGKKDGVSTVQLEATIRFVANGPSLTLQTK